MEKNRPSRTAVLVARGVATVAATPELASLVPKMTSKVTRWLLVHEGWSSATYVSLLRFRAFREMAYAISNRLTPGIFLHFALRRRFIERAVYAAIADGATQVVIVGAGLDSLAAAVARRYADVHFLEIDHPASQAVKRALLPPALTPTNMRFCPLDLALPDVALTDCPDLDPARPTVFVAEGLLMYLRVEAVERLFTMLRESTPHARVVFTAMTIQADGRPGFRRSSGLVDRWLALRKEPFEWGIRPVEVPAFLEPLGFELLDHADAERFRRENGETVGRRPIAEGEHVYVVESRGI